MMPGFSESARFYDALNRHKDYAAAAAGLCQILARFVPGASSLLDVGCGTGRHLAHLRERFRVEGLDASAEMLAIARERCPGVPMHQGSLVDFAVGRRFDVVTCLFGSIAYAGDAISLGRAVRCMAGHLEAGGVLVVEPWVAPERFVAGRLVFDSVNDPDLKVARMYLTRQEGRLSIFDSEYLVGTADGITRFRERQELGLFTDAEYRSAFDEAGLDMLDSAGDLFGYGLYVCGAGADPRVNG
jgi:SAM-dependent methyltransferase